MHDDEKGVEILPELKKIKLKKILVHSNATKITYKNTPKTTYEFKI